MKRFPVANLLAWFCRWHPCFSLDYILALDCLLVGRGIGDALGLAHTTVFLGTAACPLGGGESLSQHRGVACSGCTPPARPAFETYATLLSVGARSAHAVALLLSLTPSQTRNDTCYITACAVLWWHVSERLSSLPLGRCFFVVFFTNSRSRQT